MTDRQLLTCQRFAAFLSSGGEEDREVLAADINIVRYGYGATHDEVLEIFSGPASVIAWAQRSPDGTEFTAHRDDDGQLSYAMTVAGFNGAGAWQVKVTDDGKISHLSHRPRDLNESLQTDDEWREAVRVSHEMRDSPEDV